MEVPAFSGPWAGEFADAFRQSGSDFEREALRDGSISESEVAEAENLFGNCMKDRGLDFNGFKPGGGFDFGLGGADPDQANAIADECSVSSGVNTVVSLYFAMQRNPQNQDEAEIIAACLVEERAVPAGYTASDYTRDAPEMAFPFTDKDSGEQALERCSKDPLGMVRAER
ncbi:hypothetical protein [Agromyces soli]|uniref:Lipoprotein n=1 Tax=Agromyces soli TaxID=659012 RepID=A0ABY4AVI1_9MICO|nr:hypothetical protein [Agromyces soli]UOE27188.1 hypothetical protein MTP13_05230 [Agromyces soli]